MWKPALTIAAALAIPATALAAPADDLVAARAEVAAGRLYSADALLQNVVTADEATVAQLQEALFLQSAIYAGDVLGAVALIQPMALATGEGSEFKAEISRQLLSARRAFEVAVNSYLIASFTGSELTQVQFSLPPLSADNVSVLMATLHDANELNSINNSYAQDPAAGRGLLAQANRYSFYLALSDAVPGTSSRNVEQIGRSFAGGQRFDHLHYLDWAARVALDMHQLLQEPNGPDLLGLAQSCDQRIMQIAGDQQNNIYVLKARQRAVKYKQ
jgi:hypothetical protein